MRFSKISFFSRFINSLLIDHPTPVNISYFWNFGVLAALSLGIQIVTGIFLGMYYVPHVDLAFVSIEHIMRDVNFGWLIRYVHSNGASFFFAVVYLHIFRGLYFGSFSNNKELVWCIGILIFILMMATAFLGYVLPWGQMSFWAATVITNFFSIIPFFGSFVVEWLWGGFSVNPATLTRFFSLHFVLPFIIVAAVLTHLIALHLVEHNSPLSGAYVNSADSISNVQFFPYFIFKDLFGIFLFLIFLTFFVFYQPNVLGHPDNYINANFLVTPPHIVPEWYFLPFYAILRSIPNKVFGVIFMFSSIIILFFLPWFSTTFVANSRFRPLFKIFFWLLTADVFLLGWVGGNPIEYPFYEIGQLATLFYFSYFLIFIPFFTYCEKNSLILSNFKIRLYGSRQ